MLVVGSVDAWIVTGGTQTGVGKIVGQAVRDYMLESDIYKQKLVVIGIADLNQIANGKAIKKESFSFAAVTEVVYKTSAKEVMFSFPFVCLSTNK